MDSVVEPVEDEESEVNPEVIASSEENAGTELVEETAEPDNGVSE